MNTTITREQFVFIFEKVFFVFLYGILSECDELISEFNLNLLSLLIKFEICEVN